jgi:hypothetical protein
MVGLAIQNNAATHAFVLGNCGYQHDTQQGGDNMYVSGGGLATSIVVFAAGAVLRFAITVNTLQHGFNVHTIGVILMIVGVVGFVLSLIAIMANGMGKHRTVIEDGRGNVVSREDTYI